MVFRGGRHGHWVFSEKVAVSTSCVRLDNMTRMGLVGTSPATTGAFHPATLVSGSTTNTTSVITEMTDSTILSPFPQRSKPKYCASLLVVVETPVRVAVDEAWPASTQGQLLDATNRVLRSLEIVALETVEVDRLNSLCLATQKHFACLSKEEVHLACDFILSLPVGTRAKVADILTTRFPFDSLGNITEITFYCCYLHRIVSETRRLVSQHSQPHKKKQLNKVNKIPGLLERPKRGRRFLMSRDYGSVLTGFSSENYMKYPKALAFSTFKELVD